MKNLLILVVSLFCFSFRPDPPIENPADGIRSGYYVFVEDYTDRSYHKYLVESKDSVDKIFNQFLGSELRLGKVVNPINIFNRTHNFYVAPVNIYQTANGKRRFKNLKYPKVYAKKRQQLNPAVF